MNDIAQYEDYLKSNGNSFSTVIQYTSILKDYAKYLEDKEIIESVASAKAYLLNKNYI